MIENSKNDKNIDKIIFEILSLKDKYSDYILSKFKNYYFDLKEYYEQLFDFQIASDLMIHLYQLDTCFFQHLFGSDIPFRSGIG